MPTLRFDPQREWLDASSPRGPGLVVLFVLLALLLALVQCGPDLPSPDASVPSASEVAAVREDITSTAAFRPWPELT